MKNREIAKVAKEVIEGKLGFKLNLNDVILLESGDDGKNVDYVLFRKAGADKIEYSARRNKTDNTYELMIYNTKSDEELYI